MEDLGWKRRRGSNPMGRAIEAFGNLLPRKQELIELLQENPGLHEREEIERTRP